MSAESPLQSPAILDWDELFFSVAFLAAMRSKAKTKIGACLVNQDQQIIGVGYNGMPLLRGEDGLKENKVNNDKLFQPKNGANIVHAATNAILFKTKNVKGCKLYLTKYPCSDCVKSILREQITELHYLENEDGNPENHDTFTTNLFKMAQEQVDFKLRARKFFPTFELTIDEEKKILPLSMENNS